MYPEQNSEPGLNSELLELRSAYIRIGSEYPELGSEHPDLSSGYLEFSSESPELRSGDRGLKPRYPCKTEYKSRMDSFRETVC